MIFVSSKRWTMGVVLGLAFGLGAYADQPSNLSRFLGDSNYTQNIFDLTAKGGLKGAPAAQPWSGSFWPSHSGSIGNSYFEGRVPFLNYSSRQILSVNANVRHYEKRMAKIREKIDHLDEDTINEMAPSEKYDLYLGDRDFSLTAANWQALREQFDLIGRVKLWEGSCQGWTTAASFSPRPEKPIRVMSLDGKYLIPFYPDDLKALSTLLWANSLIQDQAVVQGSRCRTSHPTFDHTTGHVADTNCQGVDPADFHVSVLEVIGARKSTFIVNRANRDQIWNQPAGSYDVKYFNPATGIETNLQDAIINRTAYRDPYISYRHADAVKIVGVHMLLKYVSETFPDHRDHDGESNDKIKTLDLHYDLELDASNKIVGGEWRNATDSSQNQAPDEEDADASVDEEGNQVEIPAYPGFIWKFPFDKPVAFSIGDSDLNGNDPTTLDRSALISASKKASQFRYNYIHIDANGNTVVDRAQLQPQPLQKVVKYLVDQSRS